MKRTAFKIACDAIKENEPIDRHWLRFILHRSKNEKELRDWARGCLDITLDGTESKSLIGRATTEFIRQVVKQLV